MDWRERIKRFIETRGPNELPPVVSSPGIGDRLSAIAQGVATGAQQGTADMVSGLGNLALAIDDVLPAPMQQLQGRSVESLAPYRAGRRLSQWFAEDDAPIHPDLAGSFAYQTVPQAIGSTVPFAVAGAANPALAAVAGASQGASSGYREAKAFGASEADAQRAGKFGLAIGTTEMASGGLGKPAGAALRRLFGGRIADAGQSVGRQLARSAAIEGGQEGLQQGLSNVVAGSAVGYDPTRSTFEGVPTAVAAGAVAGSAVTGSSMAMARALRRLSELQTRVENAEKRYAEQQADAQAGAPTKGDVPPVEVASDDQLLREAMELMSPEERAEFEAEMRQATAGDTDIEGVPTDRFAPPPGGFTRLGPDGAPIPSQALGRPVATPTSLFGEVPALRPGLPSAVPSQALGKPLATPRKGLDIFNMRPESSLPAEGVSDIVSPSVPDEAVNRAMSRIQQQAQAESQSPADLTRPGQVPQSPRPSPLRDASELRGDAPTPISDAYTASMANKLLRTGRAVLPPGAPIAELRQYFEGNGQPFFARRRSANGAWDVSVTRTRQPSSGIDPLDVMTQINYAAEGGVRGGRRRSPVIDADPQVMQEQQAMAQQERQRLSSASAGNVLGVPNAVQPQAPQEQSVEIPQGRQVEGQSPEGQARQDVGQDVGQVPLTSTAGTGATGTTGAPALPPFVEFLAQRGFRGKPTPLNREYRALKAEYTQLQAQDAARKLAEVRAQRPVTADDILSVVPDTDASPSETATLAATVPVAPFSKDFVYERGRYTLGPVMSADGRGEYGVFDRNDLRGGPVARFNGRDSAVAWIDTQAEADTSPTPPGETSASPKLWEMTADEFADNFYQHNVLRADAPDITGSWKSGVGPNVVPVTRGPWQNVIERKYGTRAGRPLYIVPKQWVRDTPNGPKIIDGWVPDESLKLTPTRDYQPVHELVVERALAEGKSVPDRVLRAYPDLARKYTPPVETAATSETTEAAVPESPAPPSVLGVPSKPKRSRKIGKASASTAPTAATATTPTPAPTQPDTARPPAQVDAATASVTASETVARPVTYADLEALPPGTLYYLPTRQGEKIAVRTEGRRGGGDSIHDTVEQAIAYRDSKAKRTADREKTLREIRERDEARAAQEAKERDIDGFADDKTPVQRGKIIAILNTQIKSDGVVKTRKQHIKDAIAKGVLRIGKDLTGKDTLERTDGRVKKSDGTFTTDEVFWWSLGSPKTEVEYAKYLLGKRDAATDTATTPIPSTATPATDDIFAPVQRRPVVKAKPGKSYTNHTGRKFQRVEIFRDGNVVKTYDILVREGRGQIETLTRKEAVSEARARYEAETYPDAVLAVESSATPAQDVASAVSQHIADPEMRQYVEKSVADAIANDRTDEVTRIAEAAQGIAPANPVADVETPSEAATPEFGASNTLVTRQDLDDALREAAEDLQGRVFSRPDLGLFSAKQWKALTRAAGFYTEAVTRSGHQQLVRNYRKFVKWLSEKFRGQTVNVAGRPVDMGDLIAADDKLTRYLWVTYPTRVVAERKARAERLKAENRGAKAATAEARKVLPDVMRINKYMSRIRIGGNNATVRPAFVRDLQGVGVDLSKFNAGDLHDKFELVSDAVEALTGRALSRESMSALKAVKGRDKEGNYLLRNLPSGAAKELASFAKAFNQLYQTWGKAQVLGQVRELSELATEISREVSKHTPKDFAPKDSPEVEQSRRWRSLFSKGGWDLYTASTTLAGDGSMMQRVFYDAFKEGDRAALDDLRHVVGAMETLYRRHNMSETALLEYVRDRTPIKLGGRDVQATRNELLGIYMLTRSDDGRARIVGPDAPGFVLGKTGRGDRDAVVRLKDADIKTIENAMTPFDLDLAATMFSVLQYLRPKVSSVHERLTGFPLGDKGETYWLIQVDKLLSPNRMIERGAFSSYTSDFELVDTSFLKGRKGPSTPVVVDGALNTFFRYVDGAINYGNKAEAYDTAQKLLGNGDFTTALRRKHGPDAASYLDDLTRFAAGLRVGKQSAITGVVGGFINRLAGNIALSAVSFNPSVVLVNEAGYLQAAAEIPSEAMAYWPEAYAKAHRGYIPSADMAQMLRDPDLWYRMHERGPHGLTEPVIDRSLVLPTTKMQIVFAKVARAGTAGVAHWDNLVTYATWLTMKKYHASKGLTGDALIDAANRDTASIIAKTQNAVRPIDMAYAPQAARNAVGGPLLFMLTNSGFKIRNIIHRALNKGGRDGLRSLGFVGAAAALVVALRATIKASVFGVPEEKGGMGGELSAAAARDLAGIALPGIGDNLVSLITNHLRYGGRGGDFSAVTNAITAATTGLSALSGDEKKSRAAKIAAMRLGADIAGALSLPSYPLQAGISAYSRKTDAPWPPRRRMGPVDAWGSLFK